MAEGSIRAMISLVSRETTINTIAVGGVKSFQKSMCFLS